MAKTRSCTFSGFTLIEILVALAIAAIGLVAIAKSLSHNVDIVQQLESRIIASWVASNRMSEIRMAREFRSSGESITNQEMAGRSWKIIDSYFSTTDPNIARIVVDVYEDNEPEFSIITDVGYIARYSPGVNQ